MAVYVSTGTESVVVGWWRYPRPERAGRKVHWKTAS
jgi:hypothetical protein